MLPSNVGTCSVSSFNPTYITTPLFYFIRSLCAVFILFVVERISRSEQRCAFLAVKQTLTIGVTHSLASARSALFIDAPDFQDFLSLSLSVLPPPSGGLQGPS